MCGGRLILRYIPPFSTLIEVKSFFWGGNRSIAVTFGVWLFKYHTVAGHPSFVTFVSPHIQSPIAKFYLFRSSLITDRFVLKSPVKKWHSSVSLELICQSSVMLMLVSPSFVL